MNWKKINREINESITEISKQLLIMEKKSKPQAKPINLSPKYIHDINDTKNIDVPEEYEERVNELSEVEAEWTKKYQEFGRKQREAEAKLKEARSHKISLILTGDEGEGTKDELDQLLNEFNTDAERDKEIVFKTKKYITSVDRTSDRIQGTEFINKIIELMQIHQVKIERKLAFFDTFMEMLSDYTTKYRRVKSVVALDESWIGDKIRIIINKIVDKWNNLYNWIKRTNNKIDSMLDTLEYEFQKEFKNIS